MKIENDQDQLTGISLWKNMNESNNGNGKQIFVDTPKGLYNNNEASASFDKRAKNVPKMKKSSRKIPI